MSFNVPRTSSSGSNFVTPGKIDFDPSILEEKMGCPISTRLVTRLSPGSFERTCLAFQKKANGEKTPTPINKFRNNNEHSFCKKCKTGKQVKEGTPITYLPYGIEIIEFDVAIQSNSITPPSLPSIPVVPKRKRGRPPKVKTTEVKITKEKEPRLRKDGKLKESTSNGKVTAEIVLAIRADAANGLKRKDICEKYGIHTSNARDILGRKTWRHI